MSVVTSDQGAVPSPVQDLSVATGFSLRMKIGEAGKIKGRSTPDGRLRCLHRGWRGTQRCFARAAIVLKAHRSRLFRVPSAL